ncbi:hypothetical protein PPSIR1_14445 [Plesiocystis pacifica SIR-1]|uniref:Uncharacterized protein n=1 Tax=Plesiocystis pacifica SIR-1 TaxID=391625 RepID=A6GJG7_9BACT|nr:hypothetical protein PPSIR1_14445 [Plesiocystis pacifica SIR-1]
MARRVEAERRARGFSRVSSSMSPISAPQRRAPRASSA